MSGIDFLFRNAFNIFCYYCYNNNKKYCNNNNKNIEKIRLLLHLYEIIYNKRDGLIKIS